jgi:DNA-directed RNA polymerase specialized sigma24 family protein
VVAISLPPAEEREVIITRLWGGLKFEQIAQVAGCSPSTAFRRYTAGIERLRKELSEDE